MEYRIVRSKDYLEHHGIKNQKWGIRRYQNEDGSLTALGKQHRNEREGRTPRSESGFVKAVKKVDEVTNKAGVAIAKKVSDNKKRKEVLKSQRDAAKPKSPQQMTDEELKAATARLQLEANYKTALANAHPSKKSQNEIAKIIKTSASAAASQLLTPALVYIGKDLVQSVLELDNDVMDEIYSKKKKPKNNSDDE